MSAARGARLPVRARRAALLLLAGLAAGGCSSSGEYTCPEPVGRIIRDDCEVYRTRYETLKVELGASVGPIGASVGVSRGALRDPSELLQLLAHRTHALCRDFNACRVPPLEYRKRREQADCIFTAVSAITDQLKNAARLDRESTAALVAQLARVLDGETCGGPIRSGSGAGSGGAPVPRPRKRRVGYTSWLPWFGTRFLPPQPAARHGLPQIVHARFRLQAVFRGEKPHGVIAYRPRLALQLRGEASPDDMIQVQWGDATTECPVRRGRNGLIGARCRAGKSVQMTDARLEAKVSYRRGLDGKTARIGTRSVRVLSRVSNPKNGSRRWGIDLDPMARQGYVVFRPVGRSLPAEAERPSLLVVLKLREFSGKKATARCRVDGKLATRAIEASRYSGHEGQFQDRERHRQVGPGRSVTVRHPHVHWRRYDFPLPFVASQGGASLEPKDKPWPRAGEWRCVVAWDGEPVRELTFTVRDDGRLEPHPQQTARARAAWLVRTRVLRSEVEQPL